MSQPISNKMYIVDQGAYPLYLHLIGISIVRSSVLKCLFDNFTNLIEKNIEFPFKIFLESNHTN